MRALRSRLLLATLGAIFFCSVASADFIRVSQQNSAGAYTSGPYTVLGNINVYTTNTMTTTGYYNYTSDSGHPAAPPLAINASNLFFVQATDGLGLFMMHGKEDPGSHGNNVQMQFVYDSSSKAKFLFQDDPGDSYLVDGLTDHGTHSGNTFDTEHSWSANTDGAIIGALSSSWTMYASFQSLGTNNILNSWKTYSNDGSNSSIDLNMTLNRWVRFDYVVETPVPAGIVMAGMGVVGVAFYSIRRRKAAVAV